MAILLKLTGCMLLIAGSTGYGFSLAHRYQGRIRLLVRLRQMTYLLKSQIRYTNATLDEALRAVGERSGGPLGELFQKAAGQIMQEEASSFYEAWKTSVDKLDPELPLSDADRKSLAAMAEHLGYLDLDAQERSLLLYLEELDGLIRTLQDQQREKCRLYRSLGVMAGIFLAVVIL